MLALYKVPTGAKQTHDLVKDKQMQNTVNMTQVFNSMDTRFAEAKATIARYTAEQVAEASRVALIYNRCAVTSLKHLEDVARILTK